MNKYVTEDTDGLWWIVIPADNQIDDSVVGPYASEDEALDDLQELEDDQSKF
jgi:hypothetical protein